MRNSFIKSNKEARLSSYTSLSKIYTSMHLVDVQTKKYHIVKMTDQIMECLGKDFKKMGEYEIRDDFCRRLNALHHPVIYRSVKPMHRNVAYPAIPYVLTQNDEADRAQL